MPRRNCCHIFVIPYLEADSEGSQVQDQAELHESLPLKKSVVGGGGWNGRLATIAQRSSIWLYEKAPGLILSMEHGYLYMYHS